MNAPTQMVEPPLLRFLRALDSDEKEAFAAACGTTLLYLQQMVGNPAPNPTLKLAFAIESESHRFGRIHGIPGVSLQDLLIGRIKTKQTRDHTTGELFTLMPNGELVRRRVDKQGRIVLIDQHGDVIAVEETYPGPNTVKKVRPLDDEE